MGGILALALAFGIVFGARKLCSLIGAPLWFARFLFVCAALGVTYLLAEAVVPDSKKPWGVWLAMLGAASGIIPVGFIMFKHIEEEGEDNRKAGDSPQSHSE
jgi:hypothetical protein